MNAEGLYSFVGANVILSVTNGDITGGKKRFGGNEKSEY